MTYIKLEDVMMLVQKMMKDNSNQWKEWETIHNARILEKVLCEIPSLPTINPESMIEEEIKEINKKSELWNFDERNYNRSALIMLNKLLKKFKS